MSTQNLTAAATQWQNRPDDERFESLIALHEQVSTYRAQSREVSVNLAACTVVEHPSRPGGLVMTGPNGGATEFTHHSFGQLCGVIGAPASYLRRLPAELVAKNMTAGLMKIESQEHTLLLRSNGQRHLQAVTSDRYARIWDSEIAEWCMGLQDGGWQVPPARPVRTGQTGTRIATERDVLRNSAHPGLGITVGDAIAPAGLYASDHDMFIFMVNENHGVEVDGTVLYRGFFVQNSEVGTSRLRLTAFGYESVCGNHIVWGAQVMAEVAIRHIGSYARGKYLDAQRALHTLQNLPASTELKLIETAKSVKLGDTREEIIEMVFRKDLLSKSDAEGAYVMAEQFAHVHGDPRTAWGFSSGLTRLSQGVGYADKRNGLDRAAGKILAMGR